MFLDFNDFYSNGPIQTLESRARARLPRQPDVRPPRCPLSRSLPSSNRAAGSVRTSLFRSPEPASPEVRRSLRLQRRRKVRAAIVLADVAASIEYMALHPSTQHQVEAEAKRFSLVCLSLCVCCMCWLVSLRLPVTFACLLIPYLRIRPPLQVGPGTPGEPHYPLAGNRDFAGETKRNAAAGNAEEHVTTEHNQNTVCAESQPHSNRTYPQKRPHDSHNKDTTEEGSISKEGSEESTSIRKAATTEKEEDCVASLLVRRG